MSSHKHHEHIEAIRSVIDKTENLDESQKSDSFKTIEEWVLEDRAFGTLKTELLKISLFFEEIFSELGAK